MPVWEAGTEADHEATFDTDHEFAQLPRSSADRKSECADSSAPGPFAETVEQVSGSLHRHLRRGMDMQERTDMSVVTSG